ncbi:MAG: hypothetical protein JST92_13805 [Deltaproteobacteria bacterium]|nr:hypothetical protein [Deltaproteobacteria bacterium]
MSRTHASALALVLALGATSAFAAEGSLTVKGRCMLADKAGKLSPVVGTRVEIWDSVGAPKDTDWVKGCEHGVGNACVGQGVTDATGAFTVKGDLRKMLDSGGHIIAGGEHLYARCWLRNGNALFLSTATKIPLPYEVVQSIPNAKNGASTAGDLTFKATAGDAARMFNVLQRTTDRLSKAGLGADLKPVMVLHPSGTETKPRAPGVPVYQASYAQFLTIHFIEGRPDQTVAHEFGHTTEFMYRVAFNDDALFSQLSKTFQSRQERHGQIGGGHMYWSSTNPQFAWTEGWGHFTALYGLSPSLDGNCKPWATYEKGAEADRIKIEGNIGCRLYDLSKKYGYKAIWDAVKSSKASSFPELLKALGKPWVNPHP